MSGAITIGTAYRDAATGTKHHVRGIVDDCVVMRHWCDDHGANKPRRLPARSSVGTGARPQRQSRGRVRRWQRAHDAGLSRSRRPRREATHRDRPASAEGPARRRDGARCGRGARTEPTNLRVPRRAQTPPTHRRRRLQAVQWHGRRGGTRADVAENARVVFVCEGRVKSNTYTFV